MKTIDGPSKMRFVSLVLVSLVIMYSCYVYHNYDTYNSIKVVVKENHAVEYGTANYNVNDLIKKVEGEIVSIKNDVDTSIVGEQEVVVEVKKENIVREVPIVVSVVDTVAPVIQLESEVVTITQGDDYDLTSNIVSVHDEIEGPISYARDVTEDSRSYYHFRYNDVEIDHVGSHEVTVAAKDQHGNASMITFLLKVLEPKPVYTPVYSNVAANASGGDLVSMAYSYIGSPYVAGGNGPYGFDCSGFVQHLYSRVGISISRGTYGQQFDGVPVSYESAQPGDILLWGYGAGNPTHSALYVGNGQMVHATNPRQGVIASDVAAWTRGSGTHVIAVRRIP